MQNAKVWLFTGLLLLVGGTLAIGGVVLVKAGGSAYYLATGLAVIVSAIALVRRKPLAAAAYAAMLGWTLLWALWEAGFDSWALMPRLVGPAVVGLLFLLPSITRATGAPRKWVAVPALAALLVVAAAVVRSETAESGLPGATAIATAGPTQWPHWGNSIGGAKFSPATQVNTANVAGLRPAWRYDSNIPAGALVSLEATPLAADGRLYMCLESATMVALDQDTGHEIWRYRGLPAGSPFLGWKCRGAAYAATAAAQCPRRLFITTSGGQLTALDADTGKPCDGFASHGTADLRVGMGDMAPDAALPTSPPTLVDGVVVVGQSISDFGSFDSPSGVIRGYDAVTGQLKWAWDAGRPGQTLLKPGETYTRDTPNAWGVFSGDEALGLVYVGLGNSPPDYWSGRRSKVADDFTDNLVAIDVRTGLPRWSFRTVNHDLWDYDIAAQSVAFDLPDGRPALVIPTKRGQMFVLDRRTGQPIDRVVERPVPQGNIPGNPTAATQPYTTGFAPVSGDDLTERMMWGLTPLDQMACRISFRRANYQGQFTPILDRWSLTYPAVGGGINWGSVSIDPQRGVLVVNTLHLANLNRLEQQTKEKPVKGGFEGGVLHFPMAGAPYSLAQFPFFSPLFAPCQQPPYEKIWAFDISTRKLRWSKPLGTAEESGPFGLAFHLPLRLGAPGMGGSMTTAGGLTFIAATQDRHLRAFDTGNGRELWRAKLPAVGGANPMSYVSAKTGRQYVVIAAGGHFAVPGPKASAVIAYALPK
ncbi:MAG: PQQ-binding-like beta-propeller repeat protein [Sphingomonadales bacterium]|nr:PQQ-binding-like beta-propeller repeat protein [Sphingomonadales bacterium]